MLLNLLFVSCLKWGVIGLSLSTLCANALSSVLLILALCRRNDQLKFNFKLISFDKTVVSEILRIGLPSGFLGSVFSISNVVTQSAINSLGTNVIAATSAAINIEIYIQFFGNAFAQAATTFTGQNYGAKKFNRLHRITICSLILCNIVSIVLSVATFAVSDKLLLLFVSDVSLIGIALIRMRYTLLFKPVQAVMDIMSGTLQGYGYTLVPAIVSVFLVCGVRLLWIYTVFPQFNTLGSLMIIYPITQGLAAISHTICYLLLHKKLKKQKNADE